MNSIKSPYTVAAKVMSQPSHSYKGTTLKLQYVQQSKKKEEFKMNQLLVCGLPYGVDKDEYELNIADCLDMREDEDFKLVINDDSSAVITFANSYSAKGGLFMGYLLCLYPYLWVSFVFRASGEDG